MSLESCMILLDRSQYMRNGDYIPDRLRAVKDAANLLIGAKTAAHPESTVGVAAGTTLLVSPTTDMGKLLSAIHEVELVPSRSSSASASAKESSRVSSNESSDDNVLAAVAVASLALKHRPNKNGAQRIVAFVGTPVHADTKALQKTGKSLKKNNVSIDIVCLGEHEHNEPALQVLVDAANGRGNNDADSTTCHLLSIPVGTLPSDVLASSPIVGGGGAQYAAAAAAENAGAGGAGGGYAEFGGIDPNMDPELAMALRVSMEEERARQERASAAAASSSEGGGEGGAAAAEATRAPSAANPPGVMDEEEALLQQALAMSMNENEPAAAEQELQEPVADPMNEDAAMQMALQMSMAAQDTANDDNDDKMDEEQQKPPGNDQE